MARICAWILLVTFYLVCAFAFGVAVWLAVDHAMEMWG